MNIEELGYIEEMRQRLGGNADDPTFDCDILIRSPLARVRLIAGWFLGDEEWADTFKDYFESQGLFLTTNENDEGII